MARNRQPKTKLARKVGEPIFGYDKNFEKKNYPPGQHGNSRRRRQSTEYGVQLKEKQKAKLTYGLLERQFRNTFEKANRKVGVTGEVLLQMLESRLDNIVYRLGLSRSRRGARQLVVHKHITVNGNIVNKPSYALRIGDVVGIRAKSKNLETIADALSKQAKREEWLVWNGDKLEGGIGTIPSRENIPENINEQLIVELYSK